MTAKIEICICAKHYSHSTHIPTLALIPHSIYSMASNQRFPPMVSVNRKPPRQHRIGKCSVDEKDPCSKPSAISNRCDERAALGRLASKRDDSVFTEPISKQEQAAIGTDKSAIGETSYIFPERRGEIQFNLN
jgi:hypothetical protein